MAEFEDDFSSIPDDQPPPKPDKQVPPPAWVTVKKKPAKTKEPEATKTPALPIACKFFKLGKCSAGKGCRFSHDPNAPLGPDTIAPEPPAPTLPCKFHAAGYCRNGPKCPFLHAPAKKSTPPPTAAPPVTKPNGVHPSVTSSLIHTSSPTPPSSSSPSIIAIVNNPNTVNASSAFPSMKATSPIPTSSSSSSSPSPTVRPTPSSSSSVSADAPFPVARSPIPSLPPSSASMDAPFPVARSPTTSHHPNHTNIMNIWPASPPPSSSSLFSSSPSSAPSSFSPRHMTNAIPSLASLPSSPSFLSSSPFSMFMSTKPEEDEDDEDDELLPIPGLTIIDDTRDDFVFNPYDDILNEDDDIDFHPRRSTIKTNGTHSSSTHSSTHPSTHATHSSSTSTNFPEDSSSARSFADIVKTNVTVQKSTHMQEEEQQQQLDDMNNNKLCQFFMQGICRYGSTCRYIHGNPCNNCDKPCLLPDNPQQNEEHILSCTMNVKMLEEREVSKEVDCGICYEKPVDKGRRFGLLSHCDHPFCLECIREWRGGGGGTGTNVPTSTLRSCPICRVTSYYIIPSEGMIFDPERKKDIIEQYKSKLTTITCKYFNNGKGVCKFGTSCMYSHTNPDGTPYIPPTPRKMQDAEGEVTFYNGLKLGAFFDVM